VPSAGLSSLSSSAHSLCSHTRGGSLGEQFADGTRVELTRRERPKLIFDADGVTPTHLSNGVVGPLGTYTLVTPLGTSKKRRMASSAEQSSTAAPSQPAQLRASDAPLAKKANPVMPAQLTTASMHKTSTTAAPGQLTKVSLDDAPSRYGARCLDGSPPAYYIRPASASANATKYVLYFQGGGRPWLTQCTPSHAIP
jgi:hypothetical protein